LTASDLGTNGDKVVFNSTVKDASDNAAVAPVLPTNNAPVVANAIADTTGTAGGAVVTVNAANTFTDADGDTLTLSATSSNPAFATVTVNGTDIEITPVAAGTATITVTAADGNGGTIDTTFDITIS